VQGISSTFTIAGVPSGRWRVIVAGERDGLVRDPEFQAPMVDLTSTLSGTAGTIRVTSAMTVTSPSSNGGPGIVSTDMPTFEWTDESAETSYSVQVHDALGASIWENTNVSASPGGVASVMYNGPAFVPGMFYQFRATALRNGSAISITDESSGVFQRAR
jgi:hypothetical protein